LLLITGSFARKFSKVWEKLDLQKLVKATGQGANTPKRGFACKKSGFRVVDLHICGKSK